MTHRSIISGHLLSAAHIHSNIHQRTSTTMQWWLLKLKLNIITIKCDKWEWEHRLLADIMEAQIIWGRTAVKSVSKFLENSLNLLFSNFQRVPIIHIHTRTFSHSKTFIRLSSNFKARLLTHITSSTIQTRLILKAYHLHQSSQLLPLIHRKRFLEIPTTRHNNSFTFSNSKCMLNSSIKR